MWQGEGSDPFAPVASEPSAQAPDVLPAEQQPETEISDQTTSSDEAAPVTPQPVSDESAATPQDINDLSATTEDLATDDNESAHMVPIHWTASESIDHARSKKWYAGAAIIAAIIIVGLVVLDIFRIIDLMTMITTGVLVIMMLIAVFMVTKKPVREIDYILTESGLTIAGQLHPFNEFRGFGVRHQGALWQLVLLPVKRFGLSVTMFIHEDQGEEIVDTLGMILPMEDVKTDLIDNITRRLKI